MERGVRQMKTVSEKENQQKLVNKRTDIMSSLHNIKLPLQNITDCNTNYDVNVSLCQNQNYNYNNYQNQYKSLKPSQPEFLNISVRSNNQIRSPYQLSSYRDYKFTKMSISNYNYNSNYKDLKEKAKKNTLTISQQYCKKYYQQVQYFLSRQTLNKKSRFLSGHKIDALLRARMIDWMIEVISSYNFHNKTYFTSIQIMDRYFLACTEMLVPTQLHVIGVCSMLAATKMQQIYPLKLKTTYQKIVHKKITIQELIQTQSKILQTLNFNMITSSLYDLVMTKITKHLTQNQLYNEKNIKQLEEICCCVTRFVYFNYELISGQFGRDVLLNAIFAYVLALSKQFQNRVQVFLNLQQMDCRDKIIECISSFKQKYKGLNNISKFTSRKIMDLVDPYLI